MTKQTIEVELPEGWKVKEYRMPNKGDYFWYQNRVCVASSSFIDQRLIIEKIQPRRIVLEEVRCDYNVMPGEFYGDEIAGFHKNNHDEEAITLHLPKTVWREVK